MSGKPELGWPELGAVRRWAYDIKSGREVAESLLDPNMQYQRKSLALRHAPGRARTCNPMIRSHILYPIELRVLGSRQS